MPANNTVIEYALNDNITVQCSVFNDQNEQTLTQWHLRNFMDRGLQVAILALPSGSVILGGTPNPSVSFFPTFEDQITFLGIDATNHEIELVCGTKPNFELGQFLLRLLRKYYCS